MAIPPIRAHVMPLRGTYAELVDNLNNIYEGELCYATDQSVHYVKFGCVLVRVGATGDQGELAQTAVQPWEIEGSIYEPIALNGQGLVQNISTLIYERDIVDFGGAHFNIHAQANTGSWYGELVVSSHLPTMTLDHTIAWELPIGTTPPNITFNVQAFNLKVQVSMESDIQLSMVRGRAFTP